MQPPGPGADRVRLVDDEQGAGLARHAAQLCVVALVRQDDADVRQGRLGEDAGHVAGLKRALQSLEVVPLDYLARDRRVYRRPGVARLGARDAVVDGDDRLVHGAVVTVVVDEDLGALGDVTGEAHGEAVGVRRRERQLPVLQAEAPAEFAGHPEGVLSRQHGRDAAAGLLRDGPDRGVRRVAGHGARVAEAEVDVLVAVDAGEARAVGFRDVGREGARPARHPVHGHAVEHVLLGALEESSGTRVARDEVFVLARLELRQTLAINGRRHRSPPGQSGAGPRVSVPTRSPAA